MTLHREASASRGYALVLVLWMLALLSLLAASFSRTQRIQMRIAELDLDTLQARAFAESGIWTTVGRFFDAEPALPSFTLAFDDATVDVAVEPVSARINLNTANEAQLDRLFESAGVREPERASLVARVVDWRDANREPSPHGLEDTGYEALGLNHGSKDAPFASVDELRYVPGITEPVFRRLAPLLTVYGTDSGIATAFARRRVLLAVPGAQDADVDALIAARALGDHVRLPTGSGVYRIDSTAASGNARVRLIAIIEISNDENTPYRVLAFQDAATMGPESHDADAGGA